jgi:hypothetical protein
LNNNLALSNRKQNNFKATALFTVLAALFFLCASFAPPGFTYIRSIPVASSYFVTDNIGNSYVVTNENVLNRYDNQGILKATLNNKIQGNLNNIDPGNPFEIYLFYKDQNQVMFLDNMFAIRGEINLQNPGLQNNNLQDSRLGQIVAVGRSYDNGLWLFDINDMQLKRADKSLQVLQESGNTRSFIEGTLNPDFILGYQNEVYLNNPSTGILVFDLFANYKKSIAIKGLQSFQVIEDLLYYYKDQQFRSYNLKTLEEKVIELPDTNGVVNVRIEKDRLFLLKRNELTLYGF